MEIIFDYKPLIKEVSFWSGVAFSAMFMGTLVASFIFREKVAIKLKEEASEREELPIGNEAGPLEEPDLDAMLSSKAPAPSPQATKTFSVKELGSEAELGSTAAPTGGLFTGGKLTGEPKVRSVEIPIESADEPKPLSSPLSAPLSSTKPPSPPTSEINLDIDIGEPEEKKDSDDELFLNLKKPKDKGKDDFLSLDF